MQIAIVMAGLSDPGDLSHRVLCDQMVLVWPPGCFAVKQWQALPSDLNDEAVRPIGKPLALVFRGFLVNISNPKALVFMLAVLPQFIDPHAPLGAQYLILGCDDDLR